MLPKQHRIRKTREYNKIYKSGKKFHSPYFTIIINSNNTDLPTKFGIIASKKVGNAVTRNKIKRQIRAILKDNLNTKGFDIAIIMKNEVHKLSFQELKEHISNVLSKL